MWDQNIWHFILRNFQESEYLLDNFQESKYLLDNFQESKSILNTKESNDWLCSAKIRYTLLILPIVPRN